MDLLLIIFIWFSSSLILGMIICCINRAIRRKREKLLYGSYADAASYMLEQIKYLSDVSYKVKPHSGAILGFFTSNIQNQSNFEYACSILRDNSIPIVNASENLKNSISQTSYDSKECMKSIDYLKNAYEKSEDKFEHLEFAIKKVVNIGRFIEDITKQMHLLSLNASIEAAKSGEYGRGFSIVADEIRNLSNQSSAASKEISDYVSHLKKDTASFSRYMKTFNEAVSESYKINHKLGEKVAEQGALSKEAFKGIKKVSESITDLSESIKFNRETNAAMKSSAHYMDNNLSNISDNITSLMNKWEDNLFYLKSDKMAFKMEDGEIKSIEQVN